MAIKTHKNKKAPKLRGKTSHGYGAMKKNRGSGHKGGKGNAGSGKRGDAKKPSNWGDSPSYFGKHGFSSVNDNNKWKPIAITVAGVNSYVAEWLESGVAEVKGNKIIIDLYKTKYSKLISNGMPNAAYEIKCVRATANAIAKIEKMKGKVIVEEADAEAGEE